MGAQAILVLEAGCQRRTVVAATRLRAAAAYGLLGAPGPAAATFKELAVKHIQHDTITGGGHGAFLHSTARPPTASAGLMLRQGFR
jgi:N-acetyltransferase B complex (NatB) non catalytic subunit